MRSFGLAFGLVVVCLSRVALAQQPLSDRDRERAIALMDDGVQKRDAGDLRAALKAFEEADSIVNVPSTAAAVAKTRASLGLLIEAMEAADRALSFPAQKNEPAPFKQARKDCEVLKQDLGQRLPTLAIKVSGVKPKQTCSVAVGKLSAPCDVTGRPQRMNPGVHHIVLTVDGHETAEDVTLNERQNRVLELEATPKEGTDPALKDKPSNETASYLFYGGVIAGSAGIVVGTITGVLALTNADEILPKCKGGKCPPETHDQLALSKTLGTVSTISFVVGGIGAACAISGLVMGPFGAKETPKDERDKNKNDKLKDDTAIRVTPIVWVGGAGLVGTF